MVVTRNDGERRQTVLKRAGGRIVAETRRNATCFVSAVEGNVVWPGIRELRGKDEGAPSFCQKDRKSAENCELICKTAQRELQSGGIDVNGN